MFSDECFKVNHELVIFLFHLVESTFYLVQIGTFFFTFGMQSDPKSSLVY